MRGTPVAWLVAIQVVACAQIAGFQDFSKECASKACGGGSTAGGAGSIGGKASSGGSPSQADGASGGDTTDARAAGGSGMNALTPLCAGGVDPGKAGPRMAAVQRPDGSCFWIDTTEVTIGQYTAFLDGAPPERQDAACVGAPHSRASMAGCLRGVPGTDPDGGSNPDLPQTCIDWCDAQTYCLWAGKDLCADVDSTNPVDLAGTSEFYDACAGVDPASDPYGCRSNECALTACNARNDYHQPVPVGSLPLCAVPSTSHDLVYDLSGNVGEWTNGCTVRGLAEVKCAVRGGSWESSTSALGCGALSSIDRRSTLGSVGFRCCAGFIRR